MPARHACVRTEGVSRIRVPGVRAQPERVAVHCVHPHNAPFADVEAQRLMSAVAKPVPSLDLSFFDRVVKQTAGEAKAALSRAVS